MCTLSVWPHTYIRFLHNERNLFELWRENRESEHLDPAIGKMLCCLFACLFVCLFVCFSSLSSFNADHAKMFSILYFVNQSPMLTTVLRSGHSKWYSQPWRGGLKDAVFQSSKCDVPYWSVWESKWWTSCSDAIYGQWQHTWLSQEE